MLQKTDTDFSRQKPPKNDTGIRMKRLEGRRAVVIGAGGGIGKAIAHAFVTEGAVVAMLDVNQGLLLEAVEQSPAGLIPQPYVCDVSNRAVVFDCINDFAGKQGGSGCAGEHSHLFQLCAFGQYGASRNRPDD